MNTKSPKAVIFDIETTALDESVLLASLPAFDPAEVKLGNIKDPAKQAEKVAAAEIKHKEDYLSRAALSPGTGMVAAIGYKVINDDDASNITTLIMLDEQTTEVEIIKGFWGLWQTLHTAGVTHFVGHNILDFDLPFLVNRSRILGIQTPAFLFSYKNNRVYWSERFIDTRVLWLLGRKSSDTPSSLDHISKSLGVGGKNGNGAEFGRMLKEQPQVAREYLFNDIDLTSKVADRLGIL